MHLLSKNDLVSLVKEIRVDKNSKISLVKKITSRIQQRMEKEEGILLPEGPNAVENQKILKKFFNV